MIRGFVQKVYVYVLPFKAVNPGPTHALRRSVCKSLISERCVIEVSMAGPI
jgi:hypothetical protein